MTPNLHLWLIPVLPLIGAAINGFFGKPLLAASGGGGCAWHFAARRSPWRCGWSAQFSSLPCRTSSMLAHWIRAGNFQVDFAFLP